MASISDPKKMEELNEQWMSTPREAFEGKTPAEVSQDNPSMLPFKKVETYRRAEPRVGRNDPCPCGSGKKYKKCCGRAK
jgi:preprotein translocase subunit SecA